MGGSLLYHTAHWKQCWEFLVSLEIHFRNGVLTKSNWRKQAVLTSALQERIHGRPFHSVFCTLPNQCSSSKPMKTKRETTPKKCTIVISHNDDNAVIPLPNQFPFSLLWRFKLHKPQTEEEAFARIHGSRLPRRCRRVVLACRCRPHKARGREQTFAVSHDGRCIRSSSRTVIDCCRRQRLGTAHRRCRHRLHKAADTGREGKDEEDDLCPRREARCLAAERCKILVLLPLHLFLCGRFVGSGSVDNR
jgi:hypothetical protein